MLRHCPLAAISSIAGMVSANVCRDGRTVWELAGPRILIFQEGALTSPSGVTESSHREGFEDPTCKLTGQEMVPEQNALRSFPFTMMVFFSLSYKPVSGIRVGVKSLPKSSSQVPPDTFYVLVSGSGDPGCSVVQSHDAS